MAFRLRCLNAIGEYMMVAEFFWSRPSSSASAVVVAASLRQSLDATCRRLALEKNLPRSQVRSSMYQNVLIHSAQHCDIRLLAIDC